MRRKLVAGNWKMNGDMGFAKAFSSELRDKVSGSQLACDVMIAPPAPYLPLLFGAFAESGIKLAAQNVAEYESGAFTGEVSALMLKDLGCAAALVGHSERRSVQRRWLDRSSSSIRLEGLCAGMVDAAGWR